VLFKTAFTERLKPILSLRCLLIFGSAPDLRRKNEIYFITFSEGPRRENPDIRSLFIEALIAITRLERGDALLMNSTTRIVTMNFCFIVWREVEPLG